MDTSILPQIENSIEGLPLEDQLSLLEWLVRIIRARTILEQNAGETERKDVVAPNGVSDATNGSVTTTNTVNEQAEEHNDTDSALQELVARIKATPPNPAMIIQPTISMQEVTAFWEANPPTDEDISPDEWDRLWVEFEADLKAADRAKDIAEGRL